MTHTSVPVLSKALAGPSMVTRTRSSLRTRLRIRRAGADDDVAASGALSARVQSRRCTERGRDLATDAATVEATPHVSEREARHMLDTMAAMHQREPPGRDGDKTPTSCSTRTHSSRRQNRTSYIQTHI